MGSLQITDRDKEYREIYVNSYGTYAGLAQKAATGQLIGTFKISSHNYRGTLPNSRKSVKFDRRSEAKTTKLNQPQ
jgi:hypothetical protein